jgi:hypothetical protein
MRTKTPDRALLPSLIFSERFASRASVLDNGAAITGTPTFTNNGVASAGTPTSINYKKVAFQGAKHRGFTARFRYSNLQLSGLQTPFSSLFDSAGGGAGILCRTNGTLLQFWSNIGAANVQFAHTLLAADDLAITWNEATGDAKLYNSAGLIDTRNTAGRIDAQANTLNLLSWYGSTFFIGTMHAFDLFEGVLSADEIRDVMQADTFSETLSQNAVCDLPLRSWGFEETSEALADGDMEAAGVASWGNYNTSTITKEAGARTGGTGTKVLRITKSAALGGALQSVVTSGRHYRIRGWVRSDGTAIPSVLNVSFNDIFTCPASGTWRYFDIPLVLAAGASTNIIFGKNAGGDWVEFDDVSVIPLRATTPSFGTVPTVAKLGDGVTATTFPTKLPDAGFSFDGGDYIDTGLIDPFAFNEPFSFSMHVTVRPNAAATQGLLSSRAGAGGIDIRYDTVGNLVWVLYGTPTDYIGRFGAYAGGFSGSLVCTYDGSVAVGGLRIYVNGIRVDTSNLSLGTFSAVSSGAPIQLGAINAGVFMSAGGKIRAFRAFRTELTPSQVMAEHRRLTQTVNA